jgi:tetratricopeptide (TPR) repeat protein
VFYGDPERYRSLEDAIERSKAARQVAFVEHAGEKRAAAEALLTQQRWSEAADAFLQALKERDDWQTWLGLGKAYLRGANLPGAIQCFQNAATLSHGAAEVQVALAEAKSYLLGGVGCSASANPQ